eukprot:Clim_evm7s228 gene=Clim_evmTU7s228
MAPRKLTFKAVYASSNDYEHGPEQVEQHTPDTRGWQTGRFCHYPQEIVLALKEGLCRIRKIQILSHQYKIAHRVELYIGNVTNLSQVRAASPAVNDRGKDQKKIEDKSEMETIWTRLGHVSFGSNTEAQYRARELKSIHIDTVGRFVKIVIQGSHINQYNLYNQVGIVALNIIGQPAQSGAVMKAVADAAGITAVPDQANSAVLLQSGLKLSQLPTLKGLVGDPVGQEIVQEELGPNKPMQFDPLDDMTFAMLQDPRTAEVICKLVDRKAQAVAEERFEDAKQCKQVMETLQTAGVELAKLESQKKKAVQLEDFDLAKEYKQKIDMIRRKIDDYIMTELGSDAPTVMGAKTVPAPQQTQHQGHQFPTISMTDIIPDIINRPAPPPPADGQLTHRTTTQEPCEVQDVHEAHYANNDTVIDKSNTSGISRNISPQLTHQSDPDDRPLPTLARKMGVPPDPSLSADKVDPQETTDMPPMLHAVSSAGPQNVPVQSQPCLPRTPPRGDAPVVVPVVVPADDRPLPALAKKGGQDDPFNTGNGGAGDGAADVPPAENEPELLAAKVRREMVDAINVFGELTVRKVLSKKFKYKDEGIAEVRGVLSATGDSDHTPSSVLRQTAKLLSRGVESPVINVVTLTMDCIQVLLTSYIMNNNLGHGDVGPAVHDLCEVLLSKIGESNARVGDKIRDGLVNVFNKDQCSHELVYEVCKLPKRKLQGRHMMRRMELIAIFAKGLTANAQLLPGPTVMPTVRVGLEHADGKARDAAVMACAALQGVLGQGEIDQYLLNLPPKLIESLDKARFGATQSKLRAGDQASSFGKDEQLKQLEGQMKELQALPEEHMVAAGSRTSAPDKKAYGELLGRFEKETKTPVPPHTEEESVDTPNMDKMCIFCGETDDSFTPDQLDVHYWKSCLMLTSCSHCKQIVEVSALNDHRRTECDKAKDMDRCKRCKKTMLKSELVEHSKLKCCPLTTEKQATNRCPLCMDMLNGTEGGWTEHLTTKTGCLKHRRRVKKFKN